MNYNVAIKKIMAKTKPKKRNEGKGIEKAQEKGKGEKAKTHY